jgi:hypothetical protein
VEYIQNYTSASNYSIEELHTTSFIVDTLSASNISGKADMVFNFTFASLTISSEPFNVSLATCSFYGQDVDPYLDCAGSACQVFAMRASTLSTTDRPPLDYISIANAINMFPWKTIGYKSPSSYGFMEGSTPTEMWLADTNTDFSNIFRFVNVSQVEPASFAKRFEIVLNIFWQSTYGVQFLTGNLTSNFSAYDDVVLTIGLSGISFNTSHGTVMPCDGDEYVCNRTFASILFIIPLVLLIAALLSIVLKSLILAPDILGFVSSSTGNNPLIGEMMKASYLGGLEKARLLKDVEVRIGDVEVGKEVGRVVFATRKMEMDRLRKRRLYA